jgi:hypothetical protein
MRASLAFGSREWSTFCAMSRVVSDLVREAYAATRMSAPSSSRMFVCMRLAM